MWNKSCQRRLWKDMLCTEVGRVATMGNCHNWHVACVCFANWMQRFWFVCGGTFQSQRKYREDGDGLERNKKRQMKKFKKRIKEKKQEQREKGRMEEMTKRKWSLRRVLQTQEPLVTSRWDVTAPTTSPFVGPNHCNYLFFPFPSRRVFVLAPKSDL